MGSDRQEQASKRSTQRAATQEPKKPARAARLWTFRPTRTQVEKHLTIPPDYGTVETTLEELLQRGVQMTQFYDGDKGAFCAICRQRGENWETAPAFSVWHTDLDKVRLGVWLYVTHVNPEFPYVFQTSFDFSDDW